jgi:hypothetical protein
MIQSMKYHKDLEKIIGTPLIFSDTSMNQVMKRESELGIKFPASFKEWCSLDGSVGLLKKYSHDDEPISIEKLGEPFDDWYGFGRKDFLSEGLLVFMSENQGVCNWAIRLDGKDDPEVMIIVDPIRNSNWEICSDKFSTFMYCQRWDCFPRSFYEVSAQDFSLSENDLNFLKANFTKLPETYGWPGKTNYRFKSENGSILLWHAPGVQTDWFINSPTKDGLRNILKMVWHCGNLSKSLYDLDEVSSEILKDLRKQ